MDEIKLWKVIGPENDPVIATVPTTSKTKTEEHLEEILVKAPNLLFDNLKLVSRQLETLGGPLDLLGVDEDGRLVVFELKRGVLTRDAIAQVVDYASYLSELSPASLSELITRGSGKNGIDAISDFESWYEDQFAGKSIDEIGSPRMVLVGLGVDDRARRMVEFLASRNIDISLMTFHGFSNADGVYLAKQTEVLQKKTMQSGGGSKQTNLNALAKRIKDFGVSSFFEAVVKLLREELNNAYEWPNQTGYGYYFQDTTDAGTPSNRAYASVSIPSTPKGSLIFSLWPRAIDAAGREWQTLEQSWRNRIVKRKGYLEIKIASQDDWKTVASDVAKLCGAILRGRKLLQETRLLAERSDLEDSTSVPDTPS